MTFPLIYPSPVNVLHSAYKGFSNETVSKRQLAVSPFINKIFSKHSANKKHLVLKFLLMIDIGYDAKLISTWESPQKGTDDFFDKIKS